jgi:hypothetical protein
MATGVDFLLIAAKIIHVVYIRKIVCIPKMMDNRFEIKLQMNKPIWTMPGSTIA